MKIMMIGSDAGAYGSALSMCHLMKNFNKRGIDFVGILPSSILRADIWNEFGVKIRFVNFYKWIYIPKGTVYNWAKWIYKIILNINAEIKVYKIMKEENPDIIHINTAAIGTGAIAACLSRKKLVWHFREFVEEDLGARFHGKFFSKCLFRKADARIAVSNSVRKHYQMMIHRECKCIYNGVNINKFYYKHVLFHNEEIVVTVPGRLLKSKGQYEVIQTFIELDDMLGNYKMYILGDGEEEYTKLLTELIEKYHMNDKVIMMGYVSNIHSYYRISDIVIINSAKEAFGRTTVEAMLSGCVVVGNDTGGTSELLNNGNGFLFDHKSLTLKDVLLQIICDKNSAMITAQRGQKYAKEMFTDEKNASEIIALYKEILNG